MSLDALVKEAQGLPDDLLMNAVYYLKFLKFTAAENAGASSLPQEKEKEKKKRKAGILKGKLTIPASFDDPLDDFEEYM